MKRKSVILGKWIFLAVLLTSLNCEIPDIGTRTPTSYVLAMAFDHLVKWVKDGKQPPPAPRIEVAQFGSIGVPSVIARNNLGIALGGIRLAAVDAPVGLNIGLNTALDAPSSACVRWGYYLPFDISTLSTLYPRHQQYVNLVTNISRQNTRQGYIQEADAERTVREAAFSNVGGPDSDGGFDRSYQNLQVP
jgi:Alpha/beta hydrolase domain